MLAVPEKCPACGSTYIWRAPRRLLERLVANIALNCRKPLESVFAAPAEEAPGAPFQVNIQIDIDISAHHK